MAAQFVTCQIAGGVATLTLNRPPLNILDIVKLTPPVFGTSCTPGP